MKLAAAIRLDDSRFTPQARRANQGVSALVSGVGRMVGPLAAFAAGFISARAAVSGFNRAVAEARSAERLETTLEVLTGSAARAKEVFTDLMEFSDLTPFEPGPVAAAGTQLVAYGVELTHIKDMLRDAGDMAAVFNKPLEETVGIFGRLKSGDFGEAFMALRRFGVTIEDLAGEGLEFDAGGRFVGSAEEALEAVRSVIQEKFGGTMGKVAQTGAGLMSTLQGRVSAVFRDFGDPLNESLKPIMNDTIDWLAGMQTGAKALGEDFADAVSMIYGAFADDSLGTMVGQSLMLGGAEFVNMLHSGLTRSIAAFAAGMASVGGALIDDVAAAVGLSKGGTGQTEDERRKESQRNAMANLSNTSEIVGFLDRNQLAMPEAGFRSGNLNSDINQARREIDDPQLAAQLESLVSERLKILSKDQSIAARRPKSAMERFEAGMQVDIKPLYDVEQMQAELAGLMDGIRAQRPMGSVEGEAERDRVTVSDGEDEAGGGRAGFGAGMRGFQADSLARIGMFVGSTGPSVDYARRAVQEAEKQTSILEKIRDHFQQDPYGITATPIVWT